MERGRCQSTRRVLLRPTEPEAWRAIARLASRTGQWAAALEWWKKVDDAHRLTVEDRRDFVGAGLATGEIRWPRSRWKRCWHNAPGRRRSTSCWPVKSQLARAIRFWHSIMPNARSRINAQNRTTFSPLRRSFFRSQARIRSLYASAWKQIEDVARDPKNPGSLDALAVLASEEALPPMSPPGGNPSLSLESPPAQSPTPAIEEAAPPPGGSAARRSPGEDVRRWNPRRAQYLRRNPAIR